AARFAADLAVLDRDLAAGARNGTPTGRRAHQLIEPLIGAYQQLGQTTEASALHERLFAAAPTPATYDALRAAAKRASPAVQWQQVRQRALGLLHQLARAGGPGAAETLVTVLLAEGEVAEAWEAIRRHGCSASLRLAVAERYAETSPANGIDVYRPMIDEAIAECNHQGYARAAALLGTLQGLYARTGNDFDRELATLKRVHHRKRNFIAELNRHGL
ncbi:MAG: hypothetical protein HKP61_10715, partial [Dactylosporangium sp.]|nr:hypothetical protein [Dactylosporangium sp.]NNJ61401.1 hypothetical protein [Dactylosporangium sp.]